MKSQAHRAFISLRTTAITLILAVAATGHADAPAKPDAFFPLTPAATWTYNVATRVDDGFGKFVPQGPEGADITVTLAAPADAAGRVISSGNLAYLAKEDGVYLVGKVADKKLAPLVEARKIVPASPKLGDKWEYREPAGATTAACLGVERVKVPAGEFDAAKVYLITIGGPDGAYRRETYRWFAKDVGLIKEIETAPAAQNRVRETTLQLNAHALPKTPAPAGPAPGADPLPANSSADLLATAQAAARKGDHAAALQAYDRALTDDPKLAKAHAYKTLSLIALKRFDAAESEANQALAADPADYTFQEIAGQLKIAQGQVKEGKALYEKAATLSPANAGAVYTDLAAALSARNDERLAPDIDAALKSAVAATPPSAPALFALGQSYANAARPEAKAYLQRYVEVASALPKEQRDDQKIRLAKQLIRAIDIVRGAP